MFTLRIKLAGVSHCQDAIRRFGEPGMVYRLFHETDNEWDPNAVSVQLGDIHIGYIPRKQAGIIATLLDMDVPLMAKCYKLNTHFIPECDRIGMTIDIFEQEVSNEKTRQTMVGSTI